MTALLDSNVSGAASSAPVVTPVGPSVHPERYRVQRGSDVQHVTVITLYATEYGVRDYLEDAVRDIYERMEP